MAEWSKAAVLKTVEGHTSVGSNPTPSANFGSFVEWLKMIVALILTIQPINHSTIHGEMAELAEGARLLSECVAKVAPRVRIPVSPPF